MAQYTLNSQVIANLTSFSADDRFSYSTESGFRVAIPRIGYWDYHTRAKIIELKERLIPALKLTRGGNVSTHQAEQPFEEGYSWWLAQIIHYGIELQFTRDEAKSALRHSLLTAQIRVPDRLLILERDMRSSYNQIAKYAKSIETVASTVAPICSNLLVANAPRRAWEGSSIPHDGRKDSSRDDYERLEPDNETDSLESSGTTHSIGEEKEEFESDNKLEPMRYKAIALAVSKMASAPSSSTDEHSTRGETQTRNRLPPPKFTLPKLVPHPHLRPIKKEPVEPHFTSMKDPFVDEVRIGAFEVESKRMKDVGPGAIPPKSAKRLEQGEGNHNRKMTKEEYLQMRENLTGSRDGGHTKKRSYEVPDESAILDEAQKFLNSPGRWQEEHEMELDSDALPQNKRPILLLSKTPVEPKIIPKTKRNVEENTSRITSKPTRPHQQNPKKLLRMTLDINAHSARTEREVSSNRRNRETVADVAPAAPTTSSRKSYYKPLIEADHTASNRHSTSAVAVSEAPNARSETGKATLSRSNAIPTEAGKHAGSSSPTTLDRALDRMLATQSRIDAGKVEKPTRQRVVGLSRQSGGGLLQSQAHESKGSVDRRGKDRSALVAARLAE